MKRGGVRAPARWRLAATTVVVVSLLCATSASAMPSYDSPPAGANDFSCQPTAAHPRPVVLVHGLSARMSYNWSYLSPALHDAGYCVFALTYGIDPRTSAWGPFAPGGVIRMEDSAPELAAFVDEVLAATGASEVDLVGHSEGTVMPRYYLKVLGGAAKVKEFVALTPLWRGSDFAFTATLRDWGSQFGSPEPFIDFFASICGSCPQFARGSAYLNAMNEGGEAVPGVSYTSIITRYEELIYPYTSGIMNDPAATNIIIQDVCPNDLSEHAMVAADPVVKQLILNALDPANARPVTC
jgi:triacylglycerol lipase